VAVGRNPGRREEEAARTHRQGVEEARSRHLGAAIHSHHPAEVQAAAAEVGAA